MRSVRKKDNFKLAAFLRSTILGLLVVSACFGAALRYMTEFYASPLPVSSVKNTGVIVENTAENTAGNSKEAGVTNENTESMASDNTNSETEKSVFVSTLSEEELKLQPETDTNYASDIKKVSLTEDDINKLKDFSYLKSNFYIVDQRTDLLESDINVDEFLNMDLTIDKSIGGPKVLIFHTHSSEMYADSDPSKGVEEGIWGVGEELKNILENKYGIEVLHDTGRYDVVDGKNQILGAYERMEPAIRKILEQYPTIELVIDMHRDGVNEDVRLVDDVNGKTCAKIMFFNGLCRLNENGVLSDITSLPNEYLKENLALSFNLQMTANKLFPDFTRKIYINAYRYSLHMKPKSLLIEVGAQTNTKQEAKNSMEPLADVLSRVILSE